MNSDYRRFSLNRELFPRQENYSSNRLICGHLNRLKFPPNIKTYLDGRKKGIKMRTAMAQAKRCFCRRQEQTGKRLSIIETQNTEGKQLIRRLEDIEIGGRMFTEQSTMAEQ